MKASLNNKFLLAALLACIYFIAVFCRLEWGGRYRGELFTSESALRLYYAEEVSEGKSLPTVDYKAQYPEGLELFSRNPVLMEYITGNLYAFLTPPMPFVDFIRLVIPLIASISIFAIYLLVKDSTGERITGLISALFYALALPAITRASGWEFLHETIALPCIFFQVYFFLKGVKSGKLHYSILCGLCIALALSSWKISQLYFLIYSCFIGGYFICSHFRKLKTWVPTAKVRSAGLQPCPTKAGLKSRTTRMVPTGSRMVPFVMDKGERRLYENYLITAFFAACAGLAVPFLRDGLFLTSMAMMIFYSLFLSLFLSRYEARLRVRKWFIFSICLILLVLFLPQSSRNTHVYDLLRYKLQFLGQKPADPTLLPFEVRALWIDPFITPSIFELMYFFIPLLLLGVVSLGLICRKLILRRGDISLVFILYNALAFLAAYLFIKRLRVFFVFFLILLIGYLISALLRNSGRWKWIGIIVLILALVLEFGKTLGFSTGLIYQPGLAALGIKERSNYFKATTLTRSQRELIDWIKENTGEEEVILAHYHISPVIRGYADRAVNLTSLFESRPLREKIGEYADALFGTEEDLWRLCQKFQSDYVVCSIDTVLDDSDNSWRYLADRQELDEASIGYRLHFSPEGLKRFSLLYENEYFRFYRVNAAEDKNMTQPLLTTHPLYFRPDLFSRVSSSAGRFKEYVENVYQVYLSGSRSLAAGQYEVARRAYETALLMAPDFPEPYAGLGAIAEAEGRGDDARRYYREYLRLKPGGSFAGEIRARLESHESLN